MTKTIDTLIDDIDNLLVEGVDLTDEQAERFGKNMIETIKQKLSTESRKRNPSLRMSNIGRPCDAQLYRDVNMADQAEPLPGIAYRKFLLGDIIEEVLLMLAELAGHEVTGQQSEQEIAGIKGHIDANIDGVRIDVKSASDWAFKNKFQKDGLKKEDGFGYIPQLQSYMEAGQDDPLMTVKDKGAFFVMNKVTGDLLLDFHEKKGDRKQFEKFYESKKEMIESPNIPERSGNWEPVPEGKSGNMKLTTQCSFCSHKYSCWENLRAFLPKRGDGFGPAIYLTEVKREPNMVEIDRDGNIIEKE